MAQLAESVLEAAGIKNPQRIRYLIQQSINTLELDLSNLVVLTEAASRFYAVTPIIAAMAGAKKVIALTHDSRFATADEVIAQTTALHTLCHAPDVIEIHTQRDLSLFAEADIVTNLGFVRPIDAEAIAHMKSTAVIPIMCEAWELRSSDIDLKACCDREIKVFGTNEDFPEVDVFNYSGWLALKLIIEAQIEPYKSHITVVGNDKFANTITRQMREIGLRVDHISNLTQPNLPEYTDVLLIADYTRSSPLIGDKGDVTSEQLASLLPMTTIVQFAGEIDVEGLKKHHFFVYPGIDLKPYRMIRTLADFGPKPVIELHAAGLKVGELAHSGRKSQLMQEVKPCV